MSNQELETMSRICLADAARYTYESQHDAADTTPEINHLLVQLEIEAQKAITECRNINRRELVRINKKVDAIRNQTTLDKPKSVVTLIEFALAVLDEPARKCKCARGLYINNVVNVLAELRKEITGDRDYLLSSMAAVRYLDAWEGVEI